MVEATLIRVEVDIGEPISTAAAFVGDRKIAWATEVRPDRAVRECMREARRAVTGPVRFDLPFCGKRFHVPWWERRKIGLREAAKLRSKGHTAPVAT